LDPVSHRSHQALAVSEVAGDGAHADAGPGGDARRCEVDVRIGERLGDRVEDARTAAL
jgi:hypothetical protein